MQLSRSLSILLVHLRFARREHKIRAIQTLNWWHQYGVFCVKIKTFFVVSNPSRNAATLARFRITRFYFFQSAYFMHCIEHVFFSAAAAAVVFGQHKIFLSTVINCSSFLFSVLV